VLHGKDNRKRPIFWDIFNSLVRETHAAYAESRADQILFPVNKEMVAAKEKCYKESV
jgi:hypothetical protein